MALTTFQRSVCRLLANHRIASGESYVAGASALNELIAASRVSMDIDLFHATDEALEASWDADRHLLEAHGFEVRIIRERRSFVEAEIAKDREMEAKGGVRTARRRACGGPCPARSCEGQEDSARQGLADDPAIDRGRRRPRTVKDLGEPLSVVAPGMSKL